MSDEVDHSFGFYPHRSSPAVYVAHDVAGDSTSAIPDVCRHGMCVVSSHVTYLITITAMLYRVIAPSIPSLRGTKGIDRYLPS